MSKKLIVLFCLCFCSLVFAEFERDYITTGTTVKIRNQSSTPTLQIVHNPDGSIRHLEDDPSTEANRKFAVITNSGLQLENIVGNELSTATIHSKQWQLPVNASLLIKQYLLTEIGLPDFDHPVVYALTCTSNTLIQIQWIKKDFTPHHIDYPTLP